MDCLVGFYLRPIPSKIKPLFAGMQMLDNRSPYFTARFKAVLSEVVQQRCRAS
ncbi:MAG: hypothetical protein OSB05_09235 [Akkermansiaceae bacterium]|nr:hypothetical protein [Akkermansiaceae bacterium]